VAIDRTRALSLEIQPCPTKLRSPSHRASARRGSICWCFPGLHSYLETSFPLVHQRLTRETVNDYSLIYTWPGSDPSLKPILLMAHQDVVPIAPGTEEKWHHAPFAGDIADGFIWGRGAVNGNNTFASRMTWNGAGIRGRVL